MHRTSHIWFQKHLSFAFLLHSKAFAVHVVFLPLLSSGIDIDGNEESFKPDPWQQHAGPRAWRRRDRGGGRRGRGSLFVGKMLSVFVVLLSLFFFSFCLAVPGILCVRSVDCVVAELCWFDRMS
jgi:hypothetical protein